MASAKVVETQAEWNIDASEKIQTIVALLIKKGVFTIDEYAAALPVVREVLVQEEDKARAAHAEKCREKYGPIYDVFVNTYNSSPKKE